MKSAMRDGQKDRLATIRLILAAIKQVEVDDRKDLTEADIVSILDKMGKQRRESIEQFASAGRDDLVAKETFELETISAYLPTPFTESEIEQLVEQALKQTEASTMKDMGTVMGVLKPQLQGRADMGNVSKLVKSRLSQ